MTKMHHKYCFAQQQDSSCHLMPWMNLDILKNMRNSSNVPLDLHQVGAWYSKREMLPQTYLATRAWQQAMTHLQQTAFGDLQLHVLQHGIKMGRFYDQAGNCLVQSGNPLRDYEKLLLIPFNFIAASVKLNGINNNFS